MTTMTTLEPEAPVGADQAPPGPQPAPRAVDRNPFDQDLFLQDGSDQSHAFGPHFGLRTVLRGGGAPTVVVTGELDLASGPGLAEILCAALEEHPEGVHVDLGDVSFCDGTGLRALLIAQAQARRSGHRLTIDPVSYAVARVLELTGLGAMLELTSRTP